MFTVTSKSLWVEAASVLVELTPLRIYLTDQSAFFLSPSIPKRSFLMSVPESFCSWRTFTKASWITYMLASNTLSLTFILSVSSRSMAAESMELQVAFEVSLLWCTVFLIPFWVYQDIAHAWQGASVICVIYKSWSVQRDIHKRVNYDAWDY